MAEVMFDQLAWGWTFLVRMSISVGDQRRLKNSMVGVWLAGAAVLGACSATGGSNPGSGGSAGGTSGTGDGDGDGDLAVGANSPGGESGNLTDKTLVLADTDLVLSVSGEPVSHQFDLRFDDDSIPDDVSWESSNTEIGTVSSDGVFTAFGTVGGVVTITARVGSQTVSVQITVSYERIQDETSLSPEDKEILRTGGTGGPDGIGPDGAFEVLYPYNNTVFPQGLAAPEMQLAGANADALRVLVTTTGFSYEAFVSAAEPLRFTLPAAVWKGVTLSAQPEDAVSVSISKLDAGGVTGPLEQTWNIARGRLSGVFYYNTYKSPLASDEGAIMSIRPGQAEPEVLAQGCTVCHSVSAQGNVLTAAIGWNGPAGNPESNGAYDITADGELQIRSTGDDARTYSLGALTPDGAYMVASGVPLTQLWPRGGAVNFLTQVFDTTTGDAVSAPSLTDAVKYAITPAFAPDGSRLAFNNGDGIPRGILSVMDVEGVPAGPGTAPFSFSNLRDVVFVEDTDENILNGPVVGWPSFTPDAGAVLFQEGEHFDTSIYNGAVVKAQVKMVDLNGDVVRSLAALNGYDEEGDLYLPHGAGDENMNYEPSVLPVPVGGYYWVLFTSRRSYGNTIGVGGTVPGGADPRGTEEDPSPRKKIWMAAIDADYAGKIDPSHPAFYLPGQEIEAGNMRAFAALEPCRDDGEGCESATQCCGGFCREESRDQSGLPVLVCQPPTEGECSGLEEACATSGDCCNEDHSCINSRCAVGSPPVVVK